MKAQKLFIAAAFILGFSSSAQANPEAAGEYLLQYIQKSHPANLKMCGQGLPQACQLAANVEQTLAMLGQIRQHCAQGHAGACQTIMQNAANAMAAERRDAASWAALRRARPSAQGAVRTTLGEANDITHSTNRGLIAGSSTAGVVDAIHGRRVATAPTGQRHRVDGYSKHVWVDEPQGRFVGADNPNLNPNRNRALNDRMWSLMTGG